MENHEKLLLVAWLVIGSQEVEKERQVSEDLARERERERERVHEREEMKKERGKGRTQHWVN